MSAQNDQGRGEKYMWMRSGSLANRVMSGIIACFLGAVTVLSPITKIPVYAKKSIFDLNYKEVEKKDVEIYVRAENDSFEPGHEVELKVCIENNTDMTLINGSLSWKDKKNALNEEQFIYDEDENHDIEINEKGFLKNLILKPDEIFEIDFKAVVDPSLEFVNKRSLEFFFASENEENMDEKVTQRVKFDFTTGFVTLLPVEFENDGNEVAAGTTGVMNLCLTFQDPEQDIMIPEEALATDSDAELLIETGSDAQKTKIRKIKTASNSDADIETGSDADEEKSLRIDEIIYNIESYGIKFENIKITDAVTTNEKDGIITTIKYDVDEEVPSGTYYGKVSVSVKVNGKLYYVEQGFDITVTEELLSVMAFNLQDTIIYEGEKLYNLIDLTEGNDTVVSKNLAGIISLTVKQLLQQNEGTWISDPYICLNFEKNLGTADPTWINLEEYSYMVVTFMRADEVGNRKKNMRAYLMNDDSVSESYATDSKEYICDETYGYVIFQIDKRKDHTAKKIRLDYADDLVEEGFSIDMDSISFCKDEIDAKNLGESRRPDASRDDDVETIENRNAIQFQLFDYSKYINKNKVDDTESEFRPISQYFTFRGKEGKEKTQIPNDHLNEDYDADGFTVNHATVAWNLDANGYPVLDLSRQADGTIRDLKASDLEAYDFQENEDRSLAYLFGGREDHAVTVYHPENTILVENNGHYFYDSKDNAVDFNIDDNRFYVRNYKERNSDTSKFEGYYDFLPFNYTRGMVVGNGDTGQEHHIDISDVNYWFGMRMDVDFYQGKDGTFQDEDMIFKFSGDDDVWIFIDEKLAMDLGGTHGAVSGEINFATGEVKQYLDWNGNHYENLTEGDRKYTTTLYEEFKNAYREQGEDESGIEATLNSIFETYTKDEKTYHRLKSYTPHQLSFFYMERGSSVANCSIDFNLPVVPDQSLTVTKLLKDEGGAVPDETLYKFKVLKKNSEELFIAAGTSYEILENNIKVEDGKVDANGVFTIKAGQSARFLNMLEKSYGTTEYHVVEILESEASSSNATNWDYKMLYSEVQIDDGNKIIKIIPKLSDYHCYRTDVLSAESSNVITYTNVVKTGNLEIKKEVLIGNEIEEGEKRFTFELFCEELKKKTFIVESASNAEEITFDQDGKAWITVTPKNPVKMKGLPAGIEISIKETAFDGYISGWKTENGEIKVGEETKVSIKVGETVTVTCVNRLGMVLPITGGVGKSLYRIGGMLTIFLAAGYLLLNERSVLKREER